MNLLNAFQTPRTRLEVFWIFQSHWFERLQSMLKWYWMMSSLRRKSSVKVLPVLAVHPPHNVLPVQEGHRGTTRSDKLRYLPLSESRFVQFKASTKTYKILLVPHSALPKGSAMNCIDLMVAYHDIPPLKKGVTWGNLNKNNSIMTKSNCVDGTIGLHVDVSNGWRPTFVVKATSAIVSFLRLGRWAIDSNMTSWVDLFH